MALSQDEVQAETLAQLRRLAQNPAWGLLRNRWLKHVSFKEQVKANHLRAQKWQEACKEQGEIDGIQWCLNDLDRVIMDMQGDEDVTPSY